MHVYLLRCSKALQGWGNCSVCELDLPAGHTYLGSLGQTKSMVALDKIYFLQRPNVSHTFLKLYIVYPDSSM